MANTNLEFLMISYANVMTEMKHHFDEEQIEVITEVIQNFSGPWNEDKIKLFFNPELSAEHMELILTCMENNLKFSILNEIAEAKSYENAKTIFDYYMMKNGFSASDNKKEKDVNDVKRLFNFSMSPNPFTPFGPNFNDNLFI